jgi:hypothetical protein
MDQIFDFCIIITTYNRSEMLKNLLDQINTQKKDYKLKIIILDDGSTEKYDLSDDHTYIKIFPNMGKKRFWKIINTSFKIVKNVTSKYFIYLQDDVTIVDNFFETLVNRYESINDGRKMALSFLSDYRITKPNWTGFNPIQMGEVVKTQWVELHFICEKKFFDVINYAMEPIPISRWDRDPNLSSGVGWQLSTRLHKKGFGLYHTNDTLVGHGNHESQMNKTERMINKLVI